MAKLSTHVLDTASGKPAENVTIELYKLNGLERDLLKTLKTNSDGRTDELLLDAKTMAVGEYEITFHIAEYFASRGVKNSEPAFLNRIPIQFGIADASADYHVPLLASPWSYSTYRGS